LIPPPDLNFTEDILPKAGTFLTADQQSDQTSDIIPVALSPDTDDSDMPSLSGPSFKAKAPKNGKKITNI
jgi:hypothetical protein